MKKRPDQLLEDSQTLRRITALRRERDQAATLAEFAELSMLLDELYAEASHERVYTPSSPEAVL